MLNDRQQERLMKQYFGLGLAMLAGTVIGAAAVSGLLLANAAIAASRVGS